MQTRKVIRSSDVQPFAPPGQEHAYYSRMLIDRESVGSEQLVVNEFTLKAGQRSYKGQHPCPFDEIYYVLRGRAYFYLGNEEPRKYVLEPGSIAFIPCATDHALYNVFEEDFVMLTMMPQQPAVGVNSVYDGRKRSWGSSFRLKPGAEECAGEPWHEPDGVRTP